MVEIEWDGMELEDETRLSVRERLRTLAMVVDPDGRGRLEVRIAKEALGFAVVVIGRDEIRQLGAEVRHPDLASAIQHAIDMAVSRWTAARQRAA